MKILVMRFTVLLLSGVFSCSVSQPEVEPEVEFETGTDRYEPEEPGMSIEPEPEPGPTRAELDPFPTEVHLKVIGRIATSVKRIRMEAGGWWECGTFITSEDEIYQKALLYAYAIVKSSWEVSDPPYVENPWVLNPWGLVGTIWNESKFDRCALGRYPREKAYELGILKKSRLTLSHKEEDIIKTVTDPRMLAHFKKTGFDMGMAQLLSRFYTKPNDYKYIMSVQGGALEGAYEMRDRARWCSKLRPWSCWPGSLQKWYDDKVTRWARMLGATRQEI